jgi:hypothetical protein
MFALVAGFAPSMAQATAAPAATGASTTTTTVADAPAPVQASPPTFGSESTYCTLDDPVIDESSGLAVSTWDATRLWTHNDSGDRARIFALAPPKDGRCLTAGILNLRGVDAFDAEDLAPGPNHTLWFADIGDNIGQRKRIVVDRVTEPERVSGEMSVDAQRFRYAYPDVAHDAEALLVSPRTGQLVIVTKGSTSKPRIYAAPGRPAATTAPAPADVRRLLSEGDLNAPGSGGTFEAITGGAVSPDGRVIVLRTYLDAYIYTVPGDDLVAALRSTPRQIHLPVQPQGESVAFAADGQSILLSSEGVGTPVLRLPRESADRSGVGKLVGGSSNVRPVLVVVAGMVLALVLVVVRRRRSRR